MATTSQVRGGGDEGERWGAPLFPERVRRIMLAAGPQQRTADDLDALVDYTRSMDFLRNVPVEATRKILSAAEFVRIPADRLVLVQRRNEAAASSADGSPYFIILTGRTSAHAVGPSALPLPPGAEGVPGDQDYRGGFAGDSLAPEGAAAYGTAVAFFGPGEGFGGGKLGGSPRNIGGGGGEEEGVTTWVLTATDCEMLRLTGPQYEWSKKAVAVEARAKLALLQTLPPFDGSEGEGDWPAAQLAPLARTMETHVLRRHSRLVSEGVVGDGRLYFVRDGVVRVSMRLGGVDAGGDAGGVLSGGGHATRLPPINPVNGVGGGDGSGNRGGVGGTSGRSGDGGEDGGAGDVEVAVLGPGESFGELAALSSCLQPYTVHCVTSTAKVYSVSVDALATGVRAQDERKIVAGLKRVLAAARSRVAHMINMRDGHIRHKRSVAAPGPVLTLPTMRTRSGDGGSELGGGGGGGGDDVRAGSSTPTSDQNLVHVRPGGTPTTRVPSVLTNGYMLPAPRGPGRPRTNPSAAGLGPTGGGGRSKRIGMETGTAAGPGVGMGWSTPEGAVGAARRPTPAEVLDVNATAMQALMVEPPLHSAIRKQLARHETKHPPPSPQSLATTVRSPLRSAVASPATTMMSSLWPQSSGATTTHSNASSTQSTRTRASAVFASTNLAAGLPCWNPPVPSHLHPAHPLGSGLGLGRHTHPAARVSHLDGRPTFALRGELSPEERLRAVRQVREDEKRQRWAVEEETKRKQKLGMHLPQVDEEGADGFGFPHDSYSDVISPGQHRTAMTLERALRRGGSGGKDSGVGGRGRAMGGGARPQSFAGDVDDGSSPSLKGQHGSTRLVFHCYDEEVPAYDEKSMARKVFEYESQSLRRKTRAKNTSFM